MDLRFLRPAALAVAGALALTACGGGAADDASGDGSAGAGDGAATQADGAAAGELVLVTPDPVGVNDFLKLGVAGIEAAAEASGGESRVFESSDPQSRSQNIDAAIELSPDVIVAIGFEFVDAMAELPAQHPDLQFMLVDACVEEPAPNLTCAVFREHEGAFLLGVEAGLLTETDQLGAVVALDIPPIRRFSDPFGAGAQHVNEDATFKPLYVGGSNPFADPARAKEQALTLLGGGVDYLMAAAAAGNYGVFEAVEAEGARTFGVDVNQCPAAPGVVVDNLLKKVDVAVEQGVAAILAGDGGGVKSYGLEDGGITVTALEPGLEDSQCAIAEHPDVIEKVKEIRQQIIDGELTVDDPAAA